MWQRFSPRARVAGIAQWLSARPWIATVAFVLLSVFLVAWTNYYAARADRWTDRPVYARVGYWIASSECTAQTGVLLGHCLPTGEVEGIEHVSLADDRGHTLVANIYALVTGRPMALRDLVVANMAINAAALFAAALTLFLLGWKLSALLLLLAPNNVVPGPMPGADAPATHMAAFLFALVATLLVARIPIARSERAGVRWLALIVVASVCLAWATLLRQPYGQGGFLVALLVLALRWRQSARQGEFFGGVVPWRLGVVVAAISLATFYATSGLFALRGVLYNVARSNDVIESHGISHNLYMGLAVPGNPWGIRWDDSAPLSHVGEADRVRYGSDEHYRSLRSGYVQIMLSDPLTIARIYCGKLLESVIEVSRRSKDSHKVSLAVALSLLLIAVPARSRRKPSMEEITMLVVVWASFGVVLLQGVLAMPWHQFISPGKYAAICGFAVLGECAFRRLLQEPIGDATARAAVAKGG
jgi:hypothetical protein